MKIPSTQHIHLARRKAVTLAAVAIGLLLSGLTSSASPNPGVLPAGSRPFGGSYGDWSAAWWQWIYSIPANQNPLTDSTGEFSSIGQAGPVFFLAGNQGGTTVRTCTVPAGKALFFPLLNQNWVQFPGDPNFTIEELRAIIAPLVDQPTLSCEIDGKPIVDPLGYRTQSAVFSVTVPSGNLLGLEAGTYAPCVDDGYYLMLAPLKPGVHQIHFTAKSADQAFALDVTYQLTVR